LVFPSDLVEEGVGEALARVRERGVEAAWIILLGPLSRTSPRMVCTPAPAAGVQTTSHIHALDLGDRKALDYLWPGDS
jgi:hypothetical protein